MWKIFDSMGKLVRGGFQTYLDALHWKLTFAHYGCYISKY
jgi:hypothetical protein